MKEMKDCSTHELGYIAYMNVKKIELLQNQNLAIENEIANRTKEEKNEVKAEG